MMIYDYMILYEFIEMNEYMLEYMLDSPGLQYQDRVSGNCLIDFDRI